MTADTTQEQSAAQLKELARRIHEEGEGHGNLAVIDELFPETFIDSGHPERGSGAESVKAHIVEMRRRFPDLEVRVDQLLVDGDWVVARLTSSGTHRGSFGGITASGKRATWSGVVIRRFESGRVAEQWTKFDMFRLLQQLRETAR